MWTTLKLILTIFIASFCSTNANCQAVANTATKQRDTSEYHKLQVYRQIFWDSLPKPIGWTNDFEGLFTVSQEQQFDSIITDFKNKTSINIYIVTLDTMHTSKEKFDDLALHIATNWSNMQIEAHNTVTICISAAHRRIRICNDDGIAKILTDEETKEIMDNNFIPAFKKANYYEGTLNGLSVLISTLNNKMK
jgi:uncharacterized protein